MYLQAHVGSENQKQFNSFGSQAYKQKLKVSNEEFLTFSGAIKGQNQHG